jgi:hypothetical protein
MCAGSLAEDRRSAVLFASLIGKTIEFFDFLYLCHSRGAGVILLGTAAPNRRCRDVLAHPGGRL